MTLMSVNAAILTRADGDRGASSSTRLPQGSPV
jgi:hypothetical protein